MKKQLLFFMTLFWSVWSFGQNVTTFAGSGSSGDTDGTGAAASFSGPSGVAADAAGNIYVADRYNLKIRKITSAGVVTTFAGSGSPGNTDGTGVDASFNEPAAVAIDASGNVYVADANNHKIRKITPTGVVSTFAGSGIQGSTDGTGTAASFSFPNGVAVDAFGNVYVADSQNHKIRKITPTGVVSTFAGSGSVGSTDATGTASSFNLPFGVTSDASGNVYVADVVNSKIRKITAAGVVTTFAGSGSAGTADGAGTAASFSYPQGVSIDASGNVYVADTGNNRIRKITAAGIVTTFAGSGDNGSTDGIGAAASFYAPVGVTVDGSGNVYVTDHFSDKIRKITPPPATHLNFDGTNDNVVIPDAATLDFTTAYTVEAMVKLNRTTGFHQTLVSKFEDDTNKRSWMINFGEHGTGRLAVVMTPVGTWTNPLSWNTGFLPTIGTWYHIAVVFDSSLPSNQVKLYVDGALYAQTTWSYTLTPTDANVYVGGYDGVGNGLNAGANSRFLQGNIDELRMWNVARTAEQINGSKNCELQVTETGLVAYYKFNQGLDAADNTSITTLTDATANGNNGTLVNFAKTGTTSNFLAGSPVMTGSIVPSNATVTTPVVYTQGDTATALTATTGANGSNLLWYTTSTGGTGTIAPTPSTATVGSTSYWVSSTNANGCESARTEIVVTVNASIPATHLNFDGVNDRVELSNESNFDFTSTFSIEAWIRVNSFTQEWQTLISKGAEGPRIHRFGVSDFIAFGTGPADDLVSTVSVNDGNWHHIAATCNNGFKSLYVDGVLQGTQIVGTPLVTNNDNVRIGSQIDSYSPIRAFHGDIDEVRIWNVARTAEQINGSKNCELQGNETGLVANYKFNQGIDAAVNTAITSLIDATANGNNGTLVNFTKTGTTSNFLAGSPVTTGSIIPSVATVTTPVTYTQGATATALTATVGANGSSLVWYTTATGGTGTTAPTPSTATVGSTSYWVSSTNANGCESARTEIVVTVNSVPATHLNFDGVNDYVNLSNLISGGSSYTKQAMIRPTYIASGAGQNIISNSNEVFWIFDGNIRAGNNGNFQHVLADASSLLNTWNMVTVTYDAPTTTMKLYINEILVSENNSVSATVGGNIQIGAFASIAFFNGDIDEVRIWNRALPLAEIQNNMNCELPSPSTQNSLVAYYKFNQGTDAADNTTITTLTDASGNANNGTLVNFTKTGTTSNFLAGSPIVTGTNCAVLSNESFEVANNIKMYPNPTNGIFTIETQEVSTVDVFDMIGKKVYSNKVSVGSSNIDLSNYTNGIYLLTVTNQKGNLNTYKLIKE